MAVNRRRGAQIVWCQSRRSIGQIAGAVRPVTTAPTGPFAILGVLLPISMTELGFVVAFGVLLDTLIVRSILVPALAFDLDRRIWWPSRLSR